VAELGDDARHRHAAAAAFALLHRRAGESLVPFPAAGWRNVGTAHHDDVFSDERGALTLRSAGPDDAVAVLVGGEPAGGEPAGGEWEAVGTAQTTTSSTEHIVDLTADGVRRRYRVRLTAQGAEVNGPEGQSSFARRSDDDVDERGGTAGECRAPLPGAITKVLVGVGDEVAGGAGLVVLEAMKMEHTLRSGGPGIVGQILCAPGDQVEVGDILVVVEPT
jgi:biotin carboxyl carrier protein